jgi:D-cysteine desulfhydrase
MSDRPLTELPRRLLLANLPTPLTRLSRLSADLGANIWLWRDDLTGFEGSGNKIRKLEFLAADAVAQGATRLITCGGPQSNHARATAFVARRLGLDVTLVVRAPRTGLELTTPPTGNLLLDRIFGAELVVVPFATYEAAGSVYSPFLAEVQERSLARGEKPYVIPEGGSCPLGALGYVHGIAELLSTWRTHGPGSRHPDSLVLAVGSGGTLAGAALGVERMGLSSALVHGVNVCDDAAYFQKRAGDLATDTAERYRLPWTRRTLNLLDGHVGGGYAIASDDDLRFYAHLARQEGVLLDPVYTGKAFRGLLREQAKDPRRFGRDVVFLHSGGGFATFAFAAQYPAAIAAL